MHVCVSSTPAQMDHMIRRQILRSLRKPLIVMTPKSLLRHELSVSTLEDLANGEFAVVIDEQNRYHQLLTLILFCAFSRLRSVKAHSRIGLRETEAPGKNRTKPAPPPLF
jgi:2-oxoglutarate dehydrogenase complex dehydrogenase (E1) component-like enzyme